MRTSRFRHLKALPFHTSLRGTRTQDHIAAALAGGQKDDWLLPDPSPLNKLLGRHCTQSRNAENVRQRVSCRTAEDVASQSSTTQRVQPLPHCTHAHVGPPSHDDTWWPCSALGHARGLSLSHRATSGTSTTAPPRCFSSWSRILRSYRGIPGGGEVRWLTSAAVQALPSSLAQELGDLLGDRFTNSAAVCQAHGKDESYHDCIPPNAVAFPESTEEVSEVMYVTIPRGFPM